jgi:hypothetical protein
MTPDVAKEFKWFYRHAIDAQQEYQLALDKAAAPHLAALFAI